MPSRILREGLLTSDRVAALTSDEERLYTRLILVVDDFGLCDGREAIIKARAFPLHHDITAEQISLWLDGIVTAGLGERYQVAGKPYFHLFDTRQRRRSNDPKFPLPPTLVGAEPSDDGHSSADGGHPRPRAKSNSKSNSKSGVKKGALPPLDPRPEFLPPEWEQFEKERQKNGHPMTTLARDKIVRELGEWHLQGYNIAAILDDSIKGGWTGVFAKPRHKRGGKGGRAAIDAFVARGAAGSR